jgi:hypothetical protein
LHWTAEKLPNVKTVVNRYHLYERTINRNVQKMRAAGTPCTFWRNMAMTSTGIYRTDFTKCYCWASPIEGGGSVSTQAVQPDRRHFLCYGTGILDTDDEGGIGRITGGGYQKYGYREHIISTPTKGLTRSSNNLIISGNRGSNYVISGASTSETLTTQRYQLFNFKEVDYILMNEKIDNTQNRVEYLYSTDDVNWYQLTLAEYLPGVKVTDKIANVYSSIDLPEGTEYIRFRVRLRKRTATSPSPEWNSIKFRYRNMMNFNEIDTIFSDVTTPAFLAAREQQSTVVEQADSGIGWETRFPLRFWTLPDAAIEDTDIIKFIKGTFKDRMFEVNDLIKYTYGEMAYILHRGFEANYIRDNLDLLGIVHYLI